MTLAPLISHCGRDAGTGFTSFFCSLGAGRQSVKSLLSTLYNVCRLQLWQAFQPETGSLCFTMPELPRLYNLVILSPDNFKRVFMWYWILNCNQWNICIHQQLEKLRALAHITPKITPFKPTHAGITKARTWRVSNHHIPSIIQAFQYIPFYMPLRMTARAILNISTVRFVASLSKGYTNGLTFFTCN